MGVFLLVCGDVLAILGTVNCWYWWARDYFSTFNGFYKNYTKIREIIEYSRSQNIEDIFCLFGLLITPYPEDKDATDDHSEVIANEHIQDKPIGIEANEEINTSEFVQDSYDEAEKDNDFIKPVSPN